MDEDQDTNERKRSKKVTKNKKKRKQEIHESKHEGECVGKKSKEELKETQSSLLAPKDEMQQSSWNEQKKETKDKNVPSKKSKKGLDGKRYSLFIGKLPFDSTLEEMEKFFGKNVKFSKIRMPTCPNTGKFRGFAFIDVSTEDDYQGVLAMNGCIFKNKKITVEYTCNGSNKSQARNQKIKSKTLKFRALANKKIFRGRGGKTQNVLIS